MEQYNAHIIASARRQEFTAEAAASRLAAVARRRRDDFHRGTRTADSTGTNRRVRLAA